MSKLIDTHAHLDEIQDLDSVLKNAVAAGVAAIIAVGISYESNEKTLQISQKYPNLVYPALGLHPSELGKMDDAEVGRTLQQIEENLGRAVAIGEVGLDYVKWVMAQVSRERQQAVFGEILGLAKKSGKPVLIHSRYAWKDAFNQVVEAGIEKAVFHWYTGPTGVLREITVIGYYISATPAAEYHSEHRRAIREPPLERLLLETDSPVEYGRETRYVSHPEDVRRSLMAAAEIRGMEAATLAAQTTQNAFRLFALN